MSNDVQELEVPWRISMGRYQALKGVKQPYLAEISPMQYGMMGKQAKRQYDAKRSQEWNASGACKQEYAAEVIQAFQAGRFKYGGADVSEDARRVVFRDLVEKEKATLEANEALARSANQILDFADVEVGDRVWSILGSFYGRVTKKNRLSIRVQPEIREAWMREGDTKCDLGAVVWLNYNDCQAAAKERKGVHPRKVTPLYYVVPDIKEAIA